MMGVAETCKALAVMSMAEWLSVLAMVTAVLGLAAASASPRVCLIWGPKTHRNHRLYLVRQGEASRAALHVLQTKSL